MRKHCNLARLVCLALIAPTLALAQNIKPFRIKEAPAQSLKWSYDGTQHALLLSSAKFFGDLHGTYVALNDDAIDETLVSRQFARAFSGIPEPEETMSNGDILFAMSEFKNVDVKAMLVTAPNRKDIVATALLHHNCGRNNRNNLEKSNGRAKFRDCDQMPTLTIFLPEGTPLSELPRTYLIQWMTKEEQEQNKFTDPRHAINKVKLDIQYTRPIP